MQQGWSDGDCVSVNNEYKWVRLMEVCVSEREADNKWKKDVFVGASERVGPRIYINECDKNTYIHVCMSASEIDNQRLYIS